MSRCVYRLFFSFPTGTAFTLFHDACQPPPFSLPPPGQALGVYLSSLFCFFRPVVPPSLSSASTDPSLPVLLPFFAPPLHRFVTGLRVSEGWRSRNRAWRFPRRTGRPQGWRRPAGCDHPSSVLSWLTSAASSRP